jgi:glycosyltransferase involved in cell wall biosynthesis
LTRNGGSVALGIYADSVFRVTNGAAAPAVSTDESFQLFACAVAAEIGRPVLFGRAVRGDAPAPHPLPAEASLVALPYYRHLGSAGEVARAAAGTARSFWRGLDRVDVVWVFGPNPFSLLLLTFAVVRRRRVVVGVRQDTRAYFRARTRGPLARVAAGVLDAAWRVAARRLPATVVGRELAHEYGAGALPMTATLVPAAQVATAPRAQEWHDDVELLAVGRLDVEKDPLLALQLLAELERRRPGRYRMTWVGDGPLAAAVRRRAAELGLGERVRLAGQRPFAELADAYRRAHLLVHTSRTEGLPQVLVEALAHGLPVVATAVGGVPELLDGGRAGMLVPPGDVAALADAVAVLTDDGDRRSQLVERGLELARERTLEREAARVAAFVSPRVP